MTIQEKKEKAKELFRQELFRDALPLYQEVWDVEKSEWNGYFLARCLRKAEFYDTAKELHAVLLASYPQSKPIQHEKLWLNYKIGINRWSNFNFLENAEAILAHASQHDPYTKNLFIKTVLTVARQFRPDEGADKQRWLDRLDQSLLDNKVFRFNNIAYPADRKRYFVEYADALVAQHTQADYLEKQLAQLHFKGTKHTAFLRFMVESFTFTWDHKTVISRTRLALYIKNLVEELQLRQRSDIPQIYREGKRTSVSNLSHFLFCPVSYAIQQTYEVYAQTSWERDEWKADKLYLADRLRIFKETGQLKDAFADAEINFTEELNKQIHYIFRSELIVSNTPGSDPTIFEADDQSLSGAPDYILQHPDGTKFVIIEKFSHISSADRDSPFENDLVKPLAFLNKFQSLRLRFGLILNWYWDLVDISTDENIRKKIVLRSMKIHRVDPETQEMPLHRAMEAVAEFNRKKQLVMDGDRLSWPAKCLNCSVVSYCHHKTGWFDEINLPYTLLAPGSGMDNQLNL